MIFIRSHSWLVRPRLINSNPYLPKTNLEVCFHEKHHNHPNSKHHVIWARFNMIALDRVKCWPNVRQHLLARIVTALVIKTWIQILIFISNYKSSFPQTRNHPHINSLLVKLISLIKAETNNKKIFWSRVKGQTWIRVTIMRQRNQFLLIKPEFLDLSVIRFYRTIRNNKKMVNYKRVEIKVSHQKCSTH